MSKSAEGLAKMMTVIVTVFKEADLTVSEKKTETMLLRTTDQAPRTSPLAIEAAGQRYRQATHFSYLGDLVNASADIMPEITDIKRRVQLARVCYKWFKRELYDMEAAPFTLKVRTLKAEVMENLLYGCVTWTLGEDHFARAVNGTPQASLVDHWLPAPITHRPPHVVRQGPQEGTMRDRRDHHPQRASPLCAGRTADEQ